ncbi:PREDICTED: uncharacterized protein LOC109115944 [Nelumbo nucifera]|uniref:Uncharacterized protein LOC109115944 n=1 Tax=Nelumbo nucifera TaxID=4432 RepID=A0A1U8QCX9_NELNU|nr:PREDICTED: uncharacterized protein LOC109115944 [Nelumbo nucifera]
MLIVYVDDIVITGDGIFGIAGLKSFLAIKFEIKDIGNLRYFLGIEVASSMRGIYISQRKYVLDLRQEVGRLDCKPIETLIDPNHKLGVYEKDVLLDKGVYQRLIGCLLYLCLTRLDISYAMGVVSQYMHKPRSSHMQAVNRILAYLYECPGKGILYSNYGRQKVEAYSDVD